MLAGIVRVLQGRLAAAAGAPRPGGESDNFVAVAPDLWGLTNTLEGIGGPGAARGQAAPALRLAGAALAIREHGG